MMFATEHNFNSSLSGHKFWISVRLDHEYPNWGHSLVGCKKTCRIRNCLKIVDANESLPKFLLIQSQVDTFILIAVFREANPDSSQVCFI